MAEIRKEQTQLERVVDEQLDAGYLSGGDITDNLDGKIDIAAGIGFIRKSNSPTASLIRFSWAEKLGVALTDNESNYIYLDYNAGSPEVKVQVGGSGITTNGNDKFELAEIFREGTALHITPHKQLANAAINKTQQRFYSIKPIERADGLILGEKATRNVTLTSGLLWTKLDDTQITAIDTSGSDTFDRYFTINSGATWTKQAAETQWDNLQYNDITSGLVVMTNNRYSNQYFYVEPDNSLVCVYGQAQYLSLAAAEAEKAPTIIPPRLGDHALLVGKYIFQKSQAPLPADQIISAFAINLTGAGATSHNNLSNVEQAASSVTNGHISDQAQTIAGAKTFSSIASYDTSKTFASGSNELISVKGAEELIHPTLFPVIDFLDFTTAEPPAPILKDRYINTVTGLSNVTSQSVTKDYVYEWNGTSWDETIPTAGVRVYVSTLSTWYEYTGSAWEVATGDLAQNNYYATADAGSDSIHDGRSINEAYKTIVKALTTISTLTPGSLNQFVIQNIDAKVNSENFTIQPWTIINAPNTEFTGNIVMVDNSFLICKSKTDGFIQKSTGSGSAGVVILDHLDGKNINGAILPQSGNLTVSVGRLSYGSGYVIGSLNTGANCNFVLNGIGKCSANGQFIFLNAGGSLSCTFNGEFDGGAGTIFLAGSAAGYINCKANFIHADGVGGTVYTLTTGGLINLVANRRSENVASSGPTANLLITLDADNKTRIFNNVTSQGTSLQKFTFYNGTITNTAGNTIGMQGVATLTGGLDPSYTLTGRTILRNFVSNSSTAIRTMRWTTSSVLQWDYGQYGDNNLRWRYAPGARTDMLLDINGDLWTYGVPGNVVAGGVYVFINAGGYLGTILSNREVKTNIKPIKNYRWILDVPNYTFNYRKEERVGKDKKLTGKYTDEFYKNVEVGQLVEDVTDIRPDKIFNNKEGKPTGIHYEHYKFYMLELLKEHDKRIATLEKEIEKLKGDK